MSKKLFIIIVVIFSTLSSQAQPYKNAAGIRAGYSSGLNFKHMFDNDLLVDGQALFNAKGSQLHALVEYQFTIYDKKRLYYYAGAGAFAGKWDNQTSIGAAAAFGAEYIFRQVPLAMGIEWKPIVMFYSSIDYVIPDFGITVRFLIN